MRITKGKLRQIIRESIDREKLVRDIAGELSNRAYDINLLDDINDVDPDALDFTLPEVLVSRLGPDPSQEQWSELAKAIAQGTYDSDLAEITDPEEYEDIQEEKLIDFCDQSETIIWDGMFLDSELSDKKGWGHSSIEQGINLADKIDVKNFLISHHSPSRDDKEIKNIEKKILNKKVKFASENEVIEF